VRVFVTGVTGFIGGHLARALATDGHEVGGFARLTSRLDADFPGRLYRGSLTDREAVRWAVRDFQPAAVLHLGAITPVAYSFDHPQEVVETNLLGTINLAEAVRRETACERFIFASSMEVYGQQVGRTEPFVETDVPTPSCPYAVAKHACEKYLEYLGQSYQFPWLALRQTNCYGRTADNRFIVEALITRMLKGGNVEAGEPTPVRNFIHVDDLVALYRRLLTVPSDEMCYNVYNTGPANGLTITELARKIKTLTKYPGKISWHKLPPRPGEVFYLNSVNDKVVAKTGWKPRVSLDEGLQRTVDFWREKMFPTNITLTSRCVA
jgi:nucleoside-diphosphate-sugar epimerase